MTEEVFVAKEVFYKKYSSFKDVLKNLDFLGDKGYVQYLNTKSMATALYYYENAGCYIVLTKNNEIIRVRYNKFDSLSPFVTDIASRTYKDKQVLYDKIYNSFLKNNNEEQEVEESKTQEIVLEDNKYMHVEIDASGEQVPVPNGFVGSKATGENEIDSGFVIYEGEEEVTDNNVADAQKI